MQNIVLVTFRSELSAGTSLESSHAGLLTGLRKFFEVEICAPGEEAGKEGFALAFIASGGSERGFIEYQKRLPRPLYLIADGAANSLAASLEILAWLKETGTQAEILHGDPEYLRDRIVDAMAEASVRQRLGEARIGLVGQPSEWLVASSVDPAAARARWGVDFVGIELGELEALIRSADAAESKRTAEAFIAGASGIIEPMAQEVVDAARVYLALKRLAAEHGLDALTLKCFDLLGTHHTTGCLALGLLNQEGLVSACEGDQRSAFTMLLAREFSGGPSFMANPVRIDAAARTAVFAHCTVAPSLVNSYVVRNHFESGIGVGIQGVFPEVPVTVLKIGGPALDRYFVSSGTIVANLDDPLCCRTQLEIALDEDSGYFLRSPLSNHHVILPGDEARKIAAFLEREGLTRER
jgi:L-fucose isomerase-like protein